MLRRKANYGADLDSVSADVDDLLALIIEVASRQYTPKLHGKGNTDFQLTRGLLGISMFLCFTAVDIETSVVYLRFCCPVEDNACIGVLCAEVG